MISRSMTYVLGALLASVSVAVPADAKTPAQTILASDAKGALIVIKTDWWQPAPLMQSAFKLILSTYASDDGKLTSGMFKGNALIEAKAKNFANGYLIAPIKPGRWVVQSYSQQDKWALCFNAASLQFEVKPGEVVYLGQFDAVAHRDQLTRQAVSSGKISMSTYDFADFFDLPDPPRFASVDDAQLANVRQMLAQYAPGVTAPVRAVTFGPATFGTGSTLFAERKCGGYFRKEPRRRGAETRKSARPRTPFPATNLGKLYAL